MQGIPNVVHVILPLPLTESFPVHDSPEFRVHDSMVGNPPRPNQPSGWLTFNQFFARRLNSNLRPIEEPSDNNVITSPADCTFQAAYDIGANSDIPGITLKHTHRFAHIPKLLQGSAYGDRFSGGRFAHYFLSVSSYHRFHAPVSGC